MSEKQKHSVKTYLLCQIANGEAPPAPVPPPTNLLIDETTTNGNIKLNWTAAAVQPTTYEIWRSVNGGAYAFVNSVAGNIVTFTHVAVMPANDQWYYEVRSCNGVDCSVFTDPSGIFQRFVHTANTGLLTYNFPFLQVCLADFDVSAQLAMTSINIPKLHTVRGYFGVYNNSVLATLNTNDLKTVLGVLCQVSNNSPLTTIDLPSLVTVSGGYFNVQMSATLTTLNIPALATVAGNFYCASCPNLTSVSAPALTGTIAAIVGGSSGYTSFSMPNITAVSGSVDFSACVFLASLNLGSLSSIGADLTTDSCALTTLSLPSLTSLASGALLGSNEPNLVSVNLPNLTSVAADFFFNSCTNLVTVSIPNVIFGDGFTIDLAQDALDAASVNEILARGVASGLTSEAITLDGGTNSAPSGQGVVDKATLIGNGCSVTTN